MYIEDAITDGTAYELRDLRGALPLTDGGRVVLTNRRGEFRERMLIACRIAVGTAGLAATTCLVAGLANLGWWQRSVVHGAEGLLIVLAGAIATWRATTADTTYEIRMATQFALIGGVLGTVLYGGVARSEPEHAARLPSVGNDERGGDRRGDEL